MKLKVSLILAVLLVSTNVWADSMIFVPRGTTLTSKQFRGQAMFSTNGDEGNQFSISMGLKQLELGYTHIEHPSGRKENMLSGQWNVLPETFITPAIGVGVRDVTSVSTKGIGVYAAVTKHFTLEVIENYIEDLELTLGIGAKSINGLFGGIEMKLPLYLVAQAEYDGNNWNTALCWQPVDVFRLKYYRTNSSNYYGCEFVPLEF